MYLISRWTSLVRVSEHDVEGLNTLYSGRAGLNKEHQPLGGAALAHRLSFRI